MAHLRHLLSSCRPSEYIVLPGIAISFLIAKEMAMLYYLGTPPTIKGYLTYLLEVSTFFLNLLWVAPLAFHKERRLFFLIRLALLVFAYHLISCWLAFEAFAKTNFISFVLSGESLMVGLWRLDRPLYLSFLVAVLKAISTRKLERQQLQLAVVSAQAERSRVENTMAQMQLSPHLLLNGLNYVQAYTEAKVPEVGEALSLMGQMLRQSLVNIQKVQLVPLTHAIGQVTNRINFQQLLANNSLCININTNIGDGHGAELIPPSLLMPPVENLINYGELREANHPASIQIFLANRVLRLTTWNIKRGGAVAGTGIGLQSMHQILGFYYPGRHSIVIEDTDSTYEFNLTIEF